MLNAISARWFELMVAVVWQSTALALAVACVAWLLRGSSPAVRYWLWQIVAIKLLVMPFWSWALPLPWLKAPAPVNPAPEVTPAAVEAPESLFMPEPADESFIEARPAPPVVRRTNAWARLGGLSWQSWVAIAWGAIVALQLGRLAWQRARLGRLLRATSPADARLVEMVGEVSQVMSLSRPPAARATAADCSPFVCGLRQPVLVFPAALVGSLSASELRQVVAHELAHVKRRDLIWGWIPELARIAYFFHPIAHWVAWRVRLERELACDQWAMSVGGQSPGEYAQTLVRVVSHASQPAALRAAAAHLSGDDKQ